MEKSLYWRKENVAWDHLRLKFKEYFPQYFDWLDFDGVTAIQVVFQTKKLKLFGSAQII